MGLGAMSAARVLGIATVAAVGLACTPTPTELEQERRSRLPDSAFATSEDPIEPIPTRTGADPRKVALGRALFSDPILSGNGSTSCASCHVLSEAGIVAGEARSTHPRDDTGPYNVPTVFNVAFNARFNWTGRFATLEDHLRALLLNPEVMDAGTWEELLPRVRRKYERRFVEAGYPSVSEATLIDAIVTFQRSLVTPNARFDRHLRSEEVLSEEELEGYEAFKSVGCISCHQGINVGGNVFQRFGVMEDAFEGRTVGRRDMGRFLLTGRPSDVHVFRVPSLRNVAVTAPYFHDGSARTLEDAITRMAAVQLGYVLPGPQVARIAAFLRTLTGEYEGVSVGESRR
ncbi:MAG: c-type cytochrome [Deltaproteobacteria bacterium]|nr:c-type cytochrome [Deltaproteobacteria bacterium]